MTLSILHRVTGVAMSCGLIVLAAWLMYAASGPEHYQYFRAAISSPLGIAVLIGWSFAFYLHLANGIRHLVWDTGRGFEIRQANASAWFALLFAVALTLISWLVAL